MLPLLALEGGLAPRPRAFDALGLFFLNNFFVQMSRILKNDRFSLDKNGIFCYTLYTEAIATEVTASITLRAEIRGT